MHLGAYHTKQPLQMIDDQDFGLVYVVTGNKKKYWEEALLSIRSFRRYNKKTPVVIFLDVERDIQIDNVFLRKMQPTYTFYDKWIAIKESPFIKTLYLDTDTFICSDLLEFCDYLEHFDMVLTLDQSPFAKGTNHGQSYSKYHVPKNFPIFQGGVIGVRKEMGFNDYMDKWNDLYKELSPSCDQVPLRISLYYHPDIKFLILPPEYNLKLSGPVHFQMNPVIMHDRRSFKSFYRIEAKMKKNFGVRRVYVPKLGILSNPGNMLRALFRGYF